MAIKIEIDGVKDEEVNDLCETLSTNAGRVILAGDIKSVWREGQVVGIEIGGDVEMKINPPMDPVVAELLR